MTAARDIAAAKAAVLALWQALDAAPAEAQAGAAARHVPPDVLWQGPAPVGDLTGPGALAERWLAPLRRAIPNLRRQTHIFCAGHSDGRRDGGPDGRLWVGATGYFTGTAATDFLGIPALLTPRPLRLRWAEFWQVDGGRLVRCQCLIDFVDWFEQIGRPVLPPPRGVPFVFPAPTGYEGVLSAPQDDADSAATLALGRTFIFGGLNRFDRKDLSSMGMARFFHPNVKWYGPGGIGACLSLEEFTDLHQRPWLVAYPDRQVQDLDNLFAEDRILAASGWSGVIATHTGPYQGVAATGRRIAFNGIDFWLRDGDRFTENWVFVDMIHLFAQFGVDLFARMRDGWSALGQGG
jgi:predicted ester cyclase